MPPRAASSAIPAPREDAAALWGKIDCASAERHRQILVGGDPRPDPTDGLVGATAFRRLTVFDGDDVYGERCELGLNDWREGPDRPLPRGPAPRDHGDAAAARLLPARRQALADRRPDEAGAALGRRRRLADDPALRLQRPLAPQCRDQPRRADVDSLARLRPAQHLGAVLLQRPLLPPPPARGRPPARRPQRRRRLPRPQGACRPLPRHHAQARARRRRSADGVRTGGSIPSAPARRHLPRSEDPLPGRLLGRRRQRSRELPAELTRRPSCRCPPG